MLVFATSDKGGTGRSVTSCNLAYQAALAGRDVCYADFDFGSPTAGAIFNVFDVLRGTTNDGLHRFLQGHVDVPQRIDVWASSDSDPLRDRPDDAGELVLLPGDAGGGEFAGSAEIVDRCLNFLLRQESEFDLTIVDLSAGRSYAADIVLEALSSPQLQQVPWRWLVFHRWTHQHVIAAEGLVNGDNGLIKIGAGYGHDPERLRRSIRFLRTAYQDPEGAALRGLSGTQVVWLQEQNRGLREMAGRLKVGRNWSIGEIPLDPVLQWREQILTDMEEHRSQVANGETVEAFRSIAGKLFDESAWTLL